MSGFTLHKIIDNPYYWLNRPGNMKDQYTKTILSFLPLSDFLLFLRTMNDIYEFTPISTIMNNK